MMSKNLYSDGMGIKLKALLERSAFLSCNKRNQS